MTIFHYCSVETFQSIVESGRFRLTNSLFLNDYLEIRLLPNLAATILREEQESIKRKGNLRVAEAYARAAVVIESIEFEHVYCGCFSENGDDLGQWRAYADEGRGIAIGFDLDEILEENADLNAVLELLKCGKVKYDQVEHERIVKTFLKNLYLPLNNVNALGVAQEYNAFVARSELIREGVYCKDREFRAEEEHRIVWMSSLGSNATKSKFCDPSQYFPEECHVTPMFRAAHDSIVPYVEIKATTKAINKIIVGPCFGGNEAMCAFKMFLAMQGISVTGDFISRSRATYRNT